MNTKLLTKLFVTMALLLALGIKATALPLQPPTISYPTDNQKNLLFNVQLQWNSVSGASYYALQVSSDISFTDAEDQLVNQAKVEALKWDLSGLTYGKTYYWRLRSVIAKDSLYVESAWSNAFQFTTIPTINIVGQTRVCNAIDNLKNYTVDAIPGVVYTWTVTGGTIISDGNATDNSINVQWTSTNGTGNVKVVRTSPSWGTFTDNGNINIAVDNIKTLSIATETDTYYDGKYCPNERIKFTAYFTGGTFDEADLVEYYWDFAGVKVSNTLTHTMIWKNPGTYHVKFFARTNAADCAWFTKEFDVVVANDCPVTAVLESDNMICTGTPGALFNVYVFGGAGGDLNTNYTYKWAPTYSFLNPTQKDGIYIETTRSRYVDFYATDKAGKTARLNFKVILKPRPIPDLVKVLVVPYTVDNLDFENGDENGDYKLLISYGCGGLGQAPCDDWTWNWMNANYQPLPDQNDVDLEPGINTYYLIVTNNSGCESKLYRGVVYRVRSKEIIGQDLTVGNNGASVLYAYPNPVVNQLNVFAEFEKESNISCKIIDLQGKIVKEFNNFGSVYQATLEVSDLPNGSYILTVESKNDTIVWKFNKN